MVGRAVGTWMLLMWSGLSVIAVVALALGIGSTTVMFSIVYGLVLIGGLGASRFDQWPGGNDWGLETSVRRNLLSRPSVSRSSCYP